LSKRQQAEYLRLKDYFTVTGRRSLKYRTCPTVSYLNNIFASKFLFSGALNIKLRNIEPEGSMGPNSWLTLQK
jgi:hypothetical protein